MQLEKRARPRFAYWRFDRGLTLRQTRDALCAIAGYRICSHERVRTLCLPFDDPEYSPPDEALAQAIYKLTVGEIRAEDFSPAQAAAA